MSEDTINPRVFTPHPPQGGAKKLKDFKAPLGGLGVRKQMKFEVIGTKIKILLKNVLKPPLGGLGVKNLENEKINQFFTNSINAFSSAFLPS
jgi:hypothetical protein